jgi:hypothetical protein
MQSGAEALLFTRIFHRSSRWLLSSEAPTPGDIDQAAQAYPHAFRTRWTIVLSVQVAP